MADARLRVGLLLGSFDQPLWAHRVVEEIRGASSLNLELIVLNDSGQARKGISLARFRRRCKTFLYRLYLHLDAWYFRGIPDPLVRAYIEPLLKGVPLIRIETGKMSDGGCFRHDDVERIRTYGLDVALCLDPGLRGASEIAHNGIWSYYYGDPEAIHGGPAGFWEVVESHPATGLVLGLVSKQHGSARIISQAWSRTDRYSLRKNRNNFYWKSADLARRKLEELAKFGAKSLDDDSGGFIPYDRHRYRAPGNREMARIILRLAGRHAREQVSSRVSVGQWFVAYDLRRHDDADLAVPGDGELCNFRLLMPPKDRFWADPFPVMRNGRYYIFLEELLYREKKGRIVAVALGDDGEPEEMLPVLECDYHLSFPNVFEWNGELYMVPEAVAGGSVELYRCLSFPDRWTREANLLDGFAGADPVICRIEGRWWLFVTQPTPGTECWDEELCLFHGPSPLGPWVPHRRNPVKSDVRNARSAGRLFMRDGRVFRPAQDCSGLYGSAVVVNEITRLDDCEFEERIVSRIQPRWRRGLLGVHTFNTAGRLTVVDGFHSRRRLG